MNYWLVLCAILALPIIGLAHAQIVVNSTSPCFYNYTQPYDMWKHCGATTDWLQMIVLPWQWVSGGYFPMILVSILITFSYIKYRKAIFPILGGIMFLPFAWFLFPDQFFNYALVMSILGIGLLVAWALLRQTKEYEG